VRQTAQTWIWIPIHSTDSEAEEEATQAAAEEAKPAAEDAAAASAQETQQSRFPQRERKQPKQIYKAQAATATELEEPQTYAEAMRAPDAPQWKLPAEDAGRCLRFLQFRLDSHGLPVAAGRP